MRRCAFLDRLHRREAENSEQITKIVLSLSRGCSTVAAVVWQNLRILGYKMVKCSGFDLEFNPLKQLSFIFIFRILPIPALSVC